MTIKKETWHFKITEVEGVKTLTYGDPYSAIVTLKIVNGELNVKGLLSKNKDGSKQDLKAIEKEILKLGFNEYFYLRYKNGIPKKIKKVIK